MWLNSHFLDMFRREFMGGDKNCHGIVLLHWQTSCIAGLRRTSTIHSGLSILRQLNLEI